MFEPDFDFSFEKRIIQAFKINIINQSPCKLPLLNFKVGTLKQMFKKKQYVYWIFHICPTVQVHLNIEQTGNGPFPLKQM